MEERDLLVTPVFFILFLVVAYIIRPYLTNDVTRRYFYPALLVKFFGALALGIIYQFYYRGGDTYNFHTHGSRIIWQAFIDAPTTGLSMLFSGGKHAPEFFNYSSRIYFFSDSSSFVVICFAAVFDILTFSSYSATALFFAFFSFIGSWFLFITFYKRYPRIHFWIAFGCLFIPSVFFWGSGLLKDSLIIGALGLLTWLLDELFIVKRISVLKIVLLILMLWLIFSVKKFMLQAFLPAALIWIYLTHIRLINSIVLKVMVFPVALLLVFAGAYYTALKIGEDDPRYALENIANTSQVTARDIRFQSGRAAGSGYELSAYFDGSFGGAVRLAPEAINVSLFRPYLWEVKNPLMLMTALESSLLLLFTVFIMVRRGYSALSKILNPEVAFCFTFSLVYAFAAGVSTYNFGTLARYRIAILPFYFLGLIILYELIKDKNEAALEETE